ncbi:MAG: hypothetical protein CVT98_06830, partial [Bacteroidetes bacterium HGW-Bacteroidetes-15]
MSKRKLFIIASIAILLSALSFSVIPYSPQILTKRLAKPPQIARAKEVLKDRTNMGMELTKYFINEGIEFGFDHVFGLLAESELKKL